MRLKLDENLGHLVQELFRQASHDVAAVAAEKLSSATDRDVIEACQRERRLVTLGPRLRQSPALQALALRGHRRLSTASEAIPR